MFRTNKGLIETRSEWGGSLVRTEKPAKDIKLFLVFFIALAMVFAPLPVLAFADDSAGSVSDLPQYDTQNRPIYENNAPPSFQGLTHEHDDHSSPSPNASSNSKGNNASSSSATQYPPPKKQETKRDLTLSLSLPMTYWSVKQKDSSAARPVH